MATLRCPMCGKINPAELETCAFCQARLKPLVVPSANPEIDKAGTKKLDLPDDEGMDWMNALRGAPIDPNPAAARPFLDATPAGTGAANGEATPDWLDTIRRKSAEDGILGKPGLGVPDLSQRSPFSSPMEEPGWLDDLRFEQEVPAEQEKPTGVPPRAEFPSAEPELPADWISRLSAPSPLPPARTEIIPQWNPEDQGGLDLGASFKPGELPDWLQEISAIAGTASDRSDEPRDLSEELPRLLGLERDKPAAAEPPAGDTAVTTPEADLPEWVRQFRSRTGPLSGLPPDQELPRGLETAELTWSDDNPPDSQVRGAVPGRKPPVDVPPSPRYGVEQSQPAAEQVPDWLSSLEDRAGWLPNLPAAQTGEAFPDASAPDAAGLPDWLGDLPADGGFSALETTAAAADEWPAPAELPSWIQAMRPIETAAPAPSGGPVEEEPHVESSGPLAGLQGTLSLDPVVPVYSRPPVYALQLQVTERQRLHGELFDELLAGESRPIEAPAQPLISSQRIVRALIAVALIAAVIIPMVTGIRILPIPASPPPEVLALQKSVASLPDGAPILLAVDYSPAVTGEMEAAAAGLIDSLMARGARLTLISTSPTGSALAGHLLGTVTQIPQAYMDPYTRGENVVALGYLAGGTAGLAGFAEHPRFAAPYTVDGKPAWEQPALHGVEGLAGFARVVVLTESLETGRAWIEQVGARMDQPESLLLVVSAQSAPLLRPYVESGQAAGMVAGLSGGAAYEKLAGQDGPGAANWDAFQGGLWASILLIVAGTLFYSVRAVLTLRKEKSEAAA